MSLTLGVPDLLQLSMCDGTLTPQIGSIASSTTSQDNNQWAWDPDQNKYRVWTDGAQAGRVIHSSLGIRILPDRVNRLESHNSPGSTDTAGLSVSGGTLSLVALDGTEVAAGLEDVLDTHHHRFANGSGSTQQLTFAGNVDEAGRNCAFSVWYRLSGAGATFQLGASGDEYTIPASATWRQFRVENLTPAGTTDTARINVEDGGTIDFVLQQLENPGDANYEGVGVTEPIIVAGAQAARNNSVYDITLTATELPADGFTFYCEVTPASDYQAIRMDSSVDTEETVAVLFDWDVDSSNMLRIHANGSAQATVAGTITRQESLNHCHNKTYGFALRNTPSKGFEVFCNGYGGMTQGTPFVDLPSSIRTDRIRIGRPGYGHALEFNGWIRNICIYSASASNRFTRGQLIKATGFYGGIVKLPTQTGPICFDPLVVGRIWALIPDEDVSGTLPQDRYRYLKYSNDYGVTWITAKDLEDSSASSTNPYLQMDLSGNFYYNIQKANNVDSLWKVNGSTFAISEVIASNQRPYSFNAASISGTQLTVTSHGFQYSDPIRFEAPSSGSLPSGVNANTDYWIAEIVDANTITIATSRRGTAISLGSAGSGTQTIRTNFTASWPGWNWAPISSTHIATGWYVTTEDYNDDDGETPDDVAPSGHYFFESKDAGATWAIVDRNDIFGGPGRHIHNMGCSPWDDTRLWISLGDLGSPTEGRATGWIATSDLTGTFNDVSDPDYGPTGMSFTEDGAYFGTDITTDAAGNPYARNGLNYSDNTATRRGWQTQGQFRGTHFYHLAMCGKNEAYLTGFAETTLIDQRETCIVKLVKDDGLDAPWRVDRWIPIHCRYTDGFNPYMISRDPQGVIPEWSPYVFIHCQRVDQSIASAYPDIAPLLNVGDGDVVYRIPRATPETDISGFAHASGAYPAQLASASSGSPASGTGISEDLKKLAASDADVINLTGIRVDVYSAGTAPRVHRLSVDDATTDAAGVLTLDYDAIGTVGDTVALSIKLPDGRTVHADTTVKTLVP